MMSVRAVVAVSVLVGCVWGHGRVLGPPARPTAWRYGYPTRHNYDDDGLNCGGFSHQWNVNKGRCGICGDAYDLPEPRAHELGGVYGEGIIVEHYVAGGVLETIVELTAYHRGYWQFRICPNPFDNNQECFDNHLLELEGGGSKYYPSGGGKFRVNYRLPHGLVCDHCVLQWIYVAGNNWGFCSNGTSGLGCGNQEQFRACSDISIGSVEAVVPIGKNQNDIEDIPYPLYVALKKGYFDAHQGNVEAPEETNKAVINENGIEN